jgi:hypothetical protein
MSTSPNFLRERKSLRNVAILLPFVATAQQHDDRLAAPDEIDTVTGTLIDPHLRYATTYRLHIARIAERKPADTCGDARACVAIPELANQFANTSVCRTSSIAQSLL